MTLQGQVQAVLAAKAVTSKGSRTALPTLQSAPHSFSWAACDFRSKLGDSCDTPGASSTGSFGPPKLSFLRDPGLPSQPFKGPRTAFHGQLATLGQSLDTAVTLHRQVQAAAKVVTSKGSRTALPTLQRGTAFHGQLAQFWPPKLSLLRDPGLPSQPFKGPRTAFHGQLATLGQSLDTAVTLQGQVQAVLAAKAVTSKGSRTALPTLQSAPHSFSWAACDFRSKLGDSCDTPGASTGSFGRQSCHF